MANSPMSKFLQNLRRASLRRDEAGLSDGQLLDAYIRDREEAAFAALVRRHGPMVWGVCRRVLGDERDAEDAFQAAFLVLVRKAASIVPREKVANWLYGVARQTAVKARAMAVRRKVREKQVKTMPEPAAPEQDNGHDLLPLLDRELSRLPDKYRTAIVLCDLEGKKHKEAAQQLGCPEGTLSARLARGRAMLAKRLARHGSAVTGGVLATGLSQSASAGVPASVVSSTIKAASLFAAGQAAATGVIAPTVATLVEGVLRTMLLSKLKIATAVLFVASTAVLTCGALATRQQPAPPGDVKAEAQTKPVEPPKEDKDKLQEPRRQVAKDAKDDLKLFNGSWKVVALEDEGRKAPSEALKGMRWSFNGAEVQMHDPHAGRAKASVKLDSSKTPKQIDLAMLESPGSWNGKTLQGIFTFEKDRLIICLRDPPAAEKGRPKEFKTEANSGLGMIALERISPSEKGEQKKGNTSKAKPSDTPKKDIANRDMKIIQGRWRLMKLEVNGVGTLLGFIQKSKDESYGAVFAGDKLTMNFITEGKGLKGFTVRLDAEQKPKAIDLQPLEDAKETLLGIYRLEGDDLTICYNKTGKQERPTAFENYWGARTYTFLIVLKRENPKGKKGGAAP